MSKKEVWYSYEKCPICNSKTYGVFVDHFIIYYRCEKCGERSDLLKITGFTLEEEQR